MANTPPGLMELHSANPNEPEILHPKKYLASKFPTPKKQDLKRRLQINTLYCLNYQHFFWNLQVTEKSWNV